MGGSNSETGLVGATASANLSTFVSNLTAAMASYDADGVDIDWEPLASADEPAFTALLTALRSAAPNAILTIPIGGLNMNIDTVDPFYADVAPLVDQENVMSYGMAGPWQGWQSWHSSPIGGESPTTPESIDSSVQAYLAAGLPAAKLGIGIGFYGLCYTPPVTGPLQDLGGSTIAASDGVMSYANIMADYYSASAAMWDATALVPYLTFAGATGPQGCSYISYDDAQSVGSKAAYVKANGLGGTIIWEIAEGYTGGSGGNALMEAIRAASCSSAPPLQRPWTAIQCAWIERRAHGIAIQGPWIELRGPSNAVQGVWIELRAPRIAVQGVWIELRAPWIAIQCACNHLQGRRSHWPISSQAKSWAYDKSTEALSWISVGWPIFWFREPRWFPTPGQRSPKGESS